MRALVREGKQIKHFEIESQHVVWAGLKLLASLLLLPPECWGYRHETDYLDPLVCFCCCCCSCFVLFFVFSWF